MTTDQGERKLRIQTSSRVGKGWPMLRHVRWEASSHDQNSIMRPVRIVIVVQEVRSQTKFVCLGFMAYQALKIISCQIYFYTNKQFYFKQFSLAWVHSLIVK